METLHVIPKPPYSLARTVGAFSRFSEELVDIADGSRYRRVLSDLNGDLLIEATRFDENSPREPLCLQPLAASSTSAEIESSAAESLIRMLAVNEAINPLYDLMDSHLNLKWLAENLVGLRRPLEATPFEGLVSSILAQLISIRGAAVVRAKIVKRFGSKIEYCGREYWAFPRPEEVARSSVDELCTIGMTRVKANAILCVADLAVRGELDHAQLDRHSDAEIVRHLVSLPGIGPWTAEWFLVNVMGRMATVPSGDLGIRRSTGNWLLDGEMPSPAEVREVYAQYGELRAYVAYYVLSAERYRLKPPADI